MLVGFYWFNPFLVFISKNISTPRILIDSFQEKLVKSFLSVLFITFLPMTNLIDQWICSHLISILLNSHCTIAAYPFYGVFWEKKCLYLNTAWKITFKQFFNFSFQLVFLLFFPVNNNWLVHMCYNRGKKYS